MKSRWSLPTAPRTNCSVMPKPPLNEACRSSSLVRVVRPKPDILVLGLGAGMPREGVPAEVRALAREEGVTLEALPTAPAISTYNILAGEDRRVLGAFLVQPDPAARGDG